MASDEGSRSPRPAPPPPARSVASPLQALDLNLLVAFEALYVERHVTRAARRLGLSQPAMSGALARLRAMLDDPLFVKTPSGLQATPRADALAGPVSQSLAALHMAMRAPVFVAAESRARLVVGGADAVLSVVMPWVAARVLAEAPGVQLEVLPLDPGRAVAALDAHEVDLALSVLPSLPMHIAGRLLFAFERVVVMRPGHPMAGLGWQLEDLARWPHAVVRFAGSARSDIDEVLEKNQLSRHVALLAASFLGVVPLVEASDAVAVLPRPFAAALARAGRVSWAPLPDALAGPRYPMRMLWCASRDADPALGWLRGLVLEGVSATVNP